METDKPIWPEFIPTEERERMAKQRVVQEKKDVYDQLEEAPF